MLQLILPNNYRKFSESTENLPKECFQEYELKTFFTVFRNFPNIFPVISENFRNILFTECLSEHSDQLNCLNLVPGLRMGIYEDQQIHTKTDSRPITFEYSQSDPHTNRIAYNNIFYQILYWCCLA